MRDGWTKNKCRAEKVKSTGSGPQNCPETTSGKRACCGRFSTARPGSGEAWLPKKNNTKQTHHIKCVQEGRKTRASKKRKSAGFRFVSERKKWRPTKNPAKWRASDECKHSDGDGRGHKLRKNVLRPLAANHLSKCGLLMMERNEDGTRRRERATL